MVKSLMGRMGTPLLVACVLALLPKLHLEAAGVDSATQTGASGKDGSDSGQGSRDCGIYVSFVMVGRVDDLRGDSVGRLRNGVEFLRVRAFSPCGTPFLQPRP